MQTFFRRFALYYFAVRCLYHGVALYYFAARCFYCCVALYYFAAKRLYRYVALYYFAARCLYRCVALYCITPLPCNEVSLPLCYITSPSGTLLHCFIFAARCLLRRLIVNYCTSRHYFREACHKNSNVSFSQKALP
jgi:hypothetical protein